MECGALMSRDNYRKSEVILKNATDKIYPLRYLLNLFPPLVLIIEKILATGIGLKKVFNLPTTSDKVKQIVNTLFGSNHVIKYNSDRKEQETLVDQRRYQEHLAKIKKESDIKTITDAIYYFQASKDLSYTVDVLLEGISGRDHFAWILRLAEKNDKIYVCADISESGKPVGCTFDIKKKFTSIRSGKYYYVVGKYVKNSHINCKVGHRRVQKEVPHLTNAYVFDFSIGDAQNLGFDQMKNNLKTIKEVADQYKK